MILIIFGIIFILLSLKFYKNKFVYILQLAYLWLVASFNNKNPDIINYLNGYVHWNNYNGKISEPLYWVLVRSCNMVGLDYQGFRCFYFLIVFVIFGFAIWKLSDWPNRIMALYFLYPFAADVIQVRTMMADAFIMLGIYLLVLYTSTPKKKYLIFGFLLVASSLGFHYSAVCSVIVVLALLNKKQIVKQIEPVLVIAGIGMLLFICMLPVIISTITEKGILTKAKEYSELGSNIGGLLIGLFLFRALLIVISFLIMKAKILSKEHADIVVQNNFMFKSIILLSVFVFAELFYSMELERISRIALFLGMILWSKIGSRVKGVKNICITTVLYGYMILYFAFVMMFHYSEGIKWLYFVFLPVFENNIF